MSSFTYTDPTANNKDAVRFELGDKTENRGALPDGLNFTDVEIEYLLTQENSDVNRAVARGLEVLANEWSSYSDLQVGDREELASQISRAYNRRARRQRELYGGEDGGVVSTSMIKVDGYSQSTGADEVTALVDTD